MEKNYYEILQINQNASPEIIDKAYKTLAKKYHPDLQNESNKKHYEEILKQINEAYEILSNPEKRLLYNQTLKNNTISKEEYNRVLEQNKILKNQLQNSNTNFSTKPQNTTDNYQQQLKYQEELQRAKQQAYHDAYIQDLKSRGYKIKYKKTLKDLIKDFYALIITIVVITVVLFLLWQLPFIRDFFISIYNENDILRKLINSTFY